MCSKGMNQIVTTRTPWHEKARHYRDLADRVVDPFNKRLFEKLARIAESKGRLRVGSVSDESCFNARSDAVKIAPSSCVMDFLSEMSRANVIGLLLGACLVGYFFANRV
jgi:hypothetical protein